MKLKAVLRDKSLHLAAIFLLAAQIGSIDISLEEGLHVARI